MGRNREPLILGIDPGLKCGWALIRGKRRIDSGTWRLHERKADPPGGRYVRLLSHLEKVMREKRPDLVAYEKVMAHVGTLAAHSYGGLIAVLLVACARFELPVAPVAVGTVKKEAAGKGNASKSEMIRAAKRRWSFEPVTDDDADACWIAETARVQRGKVSEP